MLKPAVLLLLALHAIASTPAGAQTPAARGGAEVQGLFESPVLYVNLDMSLDATRADTKKEGEGTTTVTMTLHRSVTGVVKLDLRNAGAVVSMLARTMDVTNMTRDQQLKFSQEMMASVDKVANWMEGAPELSDDSPEGMRKHMEEISFPVTLESSRLVKSENLRDEMNQPYDRTVRTTRTGAGKGYVGGVIKFEISKAAMKYWLVLPYDFNDLSEAQDGLLETYEDHLQAKGSPPVDTKRESRLSIGSIPRELEPDKPSGMGSFLVLTGDLDASGGKITGKRAFPMHFKDEDGPTPATLTVIFSVTRTPPPATAAGK